MKIRRLILFIITITFFVIVWFIQGYNHFGLEILKSVNITIYDVIVIMNNSAFGYSSIQAYSLFYTIPFIIFLSHFFLPENMLNVIRESKRDKLYFKKIIKITISAMLFSSIHSGVNLLLTNLFFDQNLLREMDFTSASFFNIFGLFLFYTSIGLLFEMMKDLTNSVGISFFLTFALLGGLFFFEKLYLDQSWGPLKDLVIYNKLLEEVWMAKDLLFLYLRQLLIVIFFCLIGSSIYKRKDFM
ncbi:WxPxxD family membrane protein [Paraliobacillus sp. JSM ZJ581]|uniref:WxPxxD family membrane protein n=1 Tax=Paraliobacillus sp. JSM ZJ581 TaxID=3342118 RepID=UPI0035A8B11D